MADGQGNDGDWSGALVAAFEAWAGPADEEIRPRDLGAWRMWSWGRLQGGIHAHVSMNGQSTRVEMVIVQLPLLPEGTVEQALDALDVRVTALKGLRGDPLRAALEARVVAATGGDGLFPRSFQVHCTCGQPAGKVCLHARVAVRDLARSIRTDPGGWLELRSGRVLRPRNGRYSGAAGPRRAMAPPQAEVGGEVGAYWLGPALAPDGGWRLGAAPPGSGAGARLDLPARIVPPPAWAGAGDEVARAMSALCDALACLDDGRDIEADIAAVSFGWPTPAGGG